MDQIRKFLASSAGRGVGIAAAVLMVALMVYVVRNSLGAGAAAAWSRDRMFICSETGKTFRHELTVGEMQPVDSPHSGKKTGYPAEQCLWTADGGTKSEPTYVLLNAYAGKSGPTFCPDCGRLVTPLNQPPEAGMKPPPKATEMKERR